MTKLNCGDSFLSFKAFEAKLKEYEDDNFVKFCIEDSRTLETAAKKGIKRAGTMPRELKYYYLKLMCVHGGNFKNRSRLRVRNTKTMKLGCKALISLRSKEESRSLVVTRLCEEHNHEVSEAYFKKLPCHRRLPLDTKLKVFEFLELKADKKLIQDKVLELTGKQITRKDINNIGTSGPKLKEKASKKVSDAIITGSKESPNNDFILLDVSTLNNGTSVIFQNVDSQDRDLTGSLNTIVPHGVDETPSDSCAATLTEITSDSSSMSSHNINDKPSLETEKIITQKKERFNNDRSICEENDVDTFFRSMACTVKKFSAQQKIEIKTKIFNYVMEIEKHNLERQSTQVNSGTSIYYILPQ